MEAASEIIGYLLLIMLGVVIMGLIMEGCYINLSQETADEICVQLTGDKTAVASDDGTRKLVCEVPSFDETQNIIIRDNSE